jgi:hypothetical protein
MKKLILFILLLAGTQSIWAKKIPGYMGLKFHIQYQGGINPQWNNLYESYVPYLSNNVQVGYVVSRKYEVGLQYTRIDYASNFHRLGSSQVYGSYDIETNYRRFTGNNVMAYIKFFRARKGFIAPLGRYYLLGLSYQNSKDQFRVIKDDASSLGAPNNTIVRSHDLAITIGVGRNIIIANRLLISIEGDVNLPLTSGIRAALSRNEIDNLNGISTSPNAYKKWNAVDAMLVNLIQIKIGIGALVF